MANPTRGLHGQVEMAFPAPLGEVKKVSFNDWLFCNK